MLSSPRDYYKPLSEVLCPCLGWLGCVGLGFVQNHVYRIYEWVVVELLYRGPFTAVLWTCVVKSCLPCASVRIE